MLQLVLFPFAVVYDLVTRIRNYFYDKGLKPSTIFDVPVICVGNLAVGGTGKTPMIEYLIRLLMPAYSVATLSRGYKRKTRGFRIAGPEDNALTLGDEPFQFYKKFRDKITVSVGEDRVFAIPNILQERDVNVILLDDAFQHRRVKPSFTILLSDYNRPFYEDVLLPAGRLRESRQGAGRADVVVVTKCPENLSAEAMLEIENAVKKYADKPVYFATISYGTPVSLSGNSKTIGHDIILMTGIADANPAKKYVQKHFNLLDHIAFSDHHNYSLKDLSLLEEKIKASPGVSILTTEKDSVKLEAEEFKRQSGNLPLFYLPIEIRFLKNGRNFDETVLGSLMMKL